MSKNSQLRGHFDKQYGKRDQAVLKPVSQHIYEHLITAKVIELEKLAVIDKPNLEIAC